MTLIPYSTEKEMTVLLLDSGSPSTGKTVNIAIRRSSDGKWWEGTGSTWEIAKQNNLMTEIGDGLYYYNFSATGVGSADNTFVSYYQETTIPAYGVEEFMATSLYTNVDNIGTDTGTTLPATLSTIEGKIDVIDAEVGVIDGIVDTILVDTNEIQGKLPTDNIMGSAVLTSKDDEIDAILVDTGTTLPATLSTIEGKIDVIDAEVGVIDGSVEAILVDTGTTIPAQITTHDTDIKALQRIQACPDLMYVPAGRTQINDTDGITAVATTIPLILADNLLEAGIVVIGTEYIIYTGNTDGSLTGCTRGAYGTVAAIAADNAIVSQVVLFPIRLTIKDNEGNMLAPDSIPTITIDDWNGVEEVAATPMTLISTGIYGYNYIIDYGDVAENKIFEFTTVIDAITATTLHEVVIIDQPSTLADVTGSGTGDYVLDQDGWYDTNGVKTAWTDVGVGYVRDADTGAPLDDAYVTAYPIIGGETMYSGRPPAQATTRSNGTWLMNLDAGTYTFVVEKEGFRIVGDGIFERTVG